MHTGTELKNRFLEEQKYIGMYVGLLREKTALFPKEVRNVLDTLTSYGFVEDDHSRRFSLRDQPYSEEELQNIYRQIQPAQKQLEQFLDELEVESHTVKQPKDLQNVDIRSAEGECIEYLLNALEGDLSSENIKSASKELSEQLQAHNSEMERMGEPIQYYDIENLVNYAVEGAIYILKSRAFHELAYAEGKIKEIDVVLRMSQPYAEINIYRQSFITLMTVFDATIFDMMTTALQKDFFRLIGVFGKRGKISYEDFTQFTSFTSFRDQIVDEQLKTMYLKEILFILDGLDVQCVDVKENDKFVQLVELVLRRNIHVHNRGRVDEKYLERSDNGKPKYNIYNFKPGDIADIDEQYWNMANRLCKNCIIRVADWVDSL